MKTQKFIIRDAEAGNVIDSFPTLEEAEAALNDYEAEDLANNDYLPDFYEIIEKE